MLDERTLLVAGRSREEIVSYFSVGSSTSSRISSPEEEKMLNSVVSVAKPQFCSPHDVTKHFARIVAKMWRTLICGTGQTDLEWANPAAIIPLRVHAFASLLQLYGNAALYMSKGGVTQLDGNRKFDLITLARVVSWLFDEETIFGRNVREVVGDIDLFVKTARETQDSKESDAPENPEAQMTSGKKTTIDQSKRGRHQRSNIELFNDKSRHCHSADMSDPTSDFGDLVSGLSLPLSNDQNARGLNLSLSATRQPRERSRQPTDCFRDGTFTQMQGASPAADFDFTSLYPPTSARPNLKVDSKSDFSKNMELGMKNEATTNKLDGPLTSSNVNSLMQKFGGALSGTGKNRWKTAPALATINEDDDDSETGRIFTNEEPMSPIQPSNKDGGTSDCLDSELVLHANKSSVKQFRRPKVSGKAGPSSPKKESSPMNSLPDSVHLLPSVEPIGWPGTKQKYATLNGLPTLGASPDSMVVPKSYEEIMSAGSEFLDAIGPDTR
jgi:hypothetical protein